jgi:hypothetical protein
MLIGFSRNPHTGRRVKAVAAVQPGDVLDCIDTITWKPGRSQQGYRAVGSP